MGEGRPGRAPRPCRLPSMAGIPGRAQWGGGGAASCARVPWARRRRSPAGTLLGHRHSNTTLNASGTRTRVQLLWLLPRRALRWSWNVQRSTGARVPKASALAACLCCRREPPGGHSEGSGTEAAGTRGSRQQTSRFPNLGRRPRTTGHRPPDSGRPLVASSEGTGQPSAAAYTSGQRPCQACRTSQARSVVR